jgi:cysteinyl-tRNA synthetase
MTLKLHNTLTRSKDEFVPLREGKVGIYVCGPTVYGHAHLGHAKSYISFDVLVRYLRYLGYDVTYIQNITDVGHLTDNADQGEDKLAVQAKKEQKHPMALAEYYTASFFADMDKLNCLRPDISPRASGHIPEQIALVETLLAKGYAYEAGGSVYFDVSKFKDYGKLSGRNTEEMMAGARVEVSTEKRNPADFALWKKAEPNHIMQWDSPWGKGYPGWHLECSAMSMKYLGATLDIHGGGLENQFPHHECEIAQSEGANGVQFVRYWLHNNMVTVDGQKMGKSLGNFINVKQVFSGEHERLSRPYEPLAVRQLVLNSHYRSPLDFSDAALFAAQSGLDKITSAVKSLRKAAKHAVAGEVDKAVAAELEALTSRFRQAMDDDMNTSVALSVMFDMVRLATRLLENNGTSAQTLLAVENVFRKLGGDVLGIVLEDYVEAGGSDDALLDYLVQSAIAARADARKSKDFAKADGIRKKLEELGITLEDGPQGTTWRRK